MKNLHRAGIRQAILASFVAGLMLAGERATRLIVFNDTSILFRTRLDNNL